MMNRILVIDDDNDMNILLKKFLTKHGYEVETTFSGAEGEKLMGTFKPDLVMSDYRLDDMDGAVLLTKIKEKNPSVPVIIITGYSDLRTAVKVIRLGAFDYVTKPLVPDEILLNIRKALSEDSQDKNANNGSAPSQKQGKAKNSNTQYLFSDSQQSKNLERQISLVAPTNYSVIIYGESGAGKEGVARLIHDQSNRSTKAFVAMDCGAMSKELAGSELFGHEKGAFTGALMQKTGHFEMANGGTIFLDEVANLPYEVQTLLLRVIQERTMRRIGGTKEMDIDVRIIVASNEQLMESVRKGKFREDLFHRLNEFTIEVPPLRKRKQDILFFARHFLKETAEDLQKPLTGLEPEVEEIFLNYPWYGNIRELRNVIRRAALLSNGNIDVKALPFEILNHGHLQFGLSEPETSEPREEKTPEPYQEQLSKPKLKKAALEAEYEVILSALTRANFNKSKAAEILGIDRKTLYNKMKQIKVNEK
jgi:two-component system response regulator HydG